MNYIKIELVDSAPMIKMEYDSIQSFRDLVFFMLAPSSADLFAASIEKDLMERERIDEIEILKHMQNLIKSSPILNNSRDGNFLKPSSFS